MYCEKCGGKLESYANNCAFCGTPVKKYETKVEYVQETKNKDFTPMTTAKWIGLSLLPFIPVVGIIIYLVLMFVWAFGANNKDITLKTYAKAKLILILLFIIFIITRYSIFVSFILQLLNSFKM